MWGYSFGISDIRVTLSDGSERDCLQKLYPIAQSIALGFAGSVSIGFTMVETMRRWLHNPDTTCAWLPLETAELWPKLAQRAFESAPPQEQRGHSHLMMLSADPVAKNGPGPLTYAHIFKSPDFTPVQIGVHKVVGIGSGNFIEQYRNSLSELSDNHEQNFSMMQMETNNPGGMGTGLGIRLTSLLKGTNPSGISSHLHYCWVYPGRTIIKANDHFIAGAWTGMESGSGINRPEGSTESPFGAAQKPLPGGTHFKMPKFAQTSAEFKEMIQSTGQQVEGTVA